MCDTETEAECITGTFSRLAVIGNNIIWLVMYRSWELTKSRLRYTVEGLKFCFTGFAFGRKQKIIIVKSKLYKMIIIRIIIAIANYMGQEQKSRIIFFMFYIIPHLC